MGSTNGEASVQNSSSPTKNAAPAPYPAVMFFKEMQLRRMVEDAVDWAHAYGMVMRTPQRKDCSDLCQTAPFALLPSPFPREIFEQAVNVQEAMSLLYFRISWDYEFLLRAHSEVVKTDQFTRHLVNILKAVHDEGIRQTKTLLIQRADYMCHDEGNEESKYKLKQVEVNNIAASMGSLSERATLLHRRVLEDLGVKSELLKIAIPDNKPVDTIARGIYEAWRDFNDDSALVLFVVEEVNQNQLDQRHVEYRLDELSERRAMIVRLTLTQCAKRLTLGGESGFSLIFDDIQRVAVVYFRAGYSPDNYLSESEWDARLLIEKSDAVKCPWIGLQVANTKKIQQVLSQSGAVERFFPDNPEVCVQIRDTFANMWGLEGDDEETRNIIQKAIENPELFVLKPQLEGGGGNYYGQEVADMLKKLTKDEKAAHILMERIRPMVVKNYLVRPMEDVNLVNTVGELGTYGYLYGNGSFNAKDEKVVFTNYRHGHIIRSKAENVDKGGVAVGAAVIDSPFLY